MTRSEPSPATRARSFRLPRRAGPERRSRSSISRTRRHYGRQGHTRATFGCRIHDRSARPSATISPGVGPAGAKGPEFYTCSKCIAGEQCGAGARPPAAIASSPSRRDAPAMSTALPPRPSRAMASRIPLQNIGADVDQAARRFRTNPATVRAEPGATCW